MKKALSRAHIALLLAPLLALILVITIVASAVAEFESQVAAILEIQDELTALECEGTYDDTNLDLHIWSTGSTSNAGASSSGGVSRSAEDVINGACAWAEAIAADDSFHYGYGQAAHHNGCYFCGTQKKSIKSGIVDYEKTYCCNPFVHAAFAHGGGEPTMLAICRQGSSYDFGTGKGSYHSSKLFKNLGRISASKLQKGDVLCTSRHVKLYLGDGRIAEAATTDDNKKGSSSWNNSIHIKSKVGSYDRVYRYIGPGGGTMEVIGESAGAEASSVSFSPVSEYTTLGEIGNKTGVRYSLRTPSGYSVAQSFAVVGGKFAVAYTTGPTPGTKGQVRLYNRSGGYIGSAAGNIYHANGSCSSAEGTLLVAGSMKSGHKSKAVEFSISDKKVDNKGSRSLPADASSIAYDKETQTYILSIGSSMVLYDTAGTKIRKIKRSMHGAYYQDIGAGCGYIFACHTKIKGGEGSGSNFVDVYNEATGEYCGSYHINYGELESADMIDGELVLLIHIKGSSKNYVQYTGVTASNVMLQSASIDIRVSAKKAKISNVWQISKNGITAGSETGALLATALVNRGRFYLNGRLFNAPITLKGTAIGGKISGSGWLEKRLESVASMSGEAGKATYVGVDDTDTEHSKKVLAQTGKWSNSRNPFYMGYGGLCELWCNDIYRAAGLPYSGACCAYIHGARQANRDGEIPKGALVFSGMKRDGTMYENGHRKSAYCDVCNHWAGHVAIYVGNGLIAGSQSPYLMSVDTWIDMFGYGGWSLK